LRCTADKPERHGPLTNLNVTVAGGVFTSTLDFGTNVFSGAQCWLEISVRTAGADGNFVTLSPRQLLTPTPFSIYTLKAESLSRPLPDSQLSTNVARLDLDLTFRGAVTFTGPVTGNGAGLSNVMAASLSAKQMQRLWRVSIPFVAVTNAGNAADVNGKGAVPYNFRIGKYEINNNQYVAFLNAVAGDDPKKLYSTQMASNVHGGIVRSGSPGEYLYTAKPGKGHEPVVWVDFYDALRFCNWLHNGQPSGAEDDTTTEDGAYTLSEQALAEENVLRNPDARYWLPSDDEWYKGAYHQPAEAGGDPSNYWLYPTRSNDVPFSEPPPGGINSANACCETGRMATDVGAYPQVLSFYGTLDQAGNVQEWTEWTSEFPYLRNRRVRGGSWNYNEFYSSSMDFEFDTTDYDSEEIGFRVAGQADP
jgi:formylglycine-generating enzyme required for sulfatase activity